MAIDRLQLGVERLCDLDPQSRNHIAHHRPTVQRRKVLRPIDRFDIIVEMVGPFREIGQILIRQVDEPFAHIFLGKRNEECADGIANAARPRMQHDPHAVFRIQAQLDEMVARSKRTQMRQVVGVLQPRMLVAQPLKPHRERCPGIDNRRRRITPRPFIAPTPPRRASVGHRLFNRIADPIEIVRQIIRVERGPRGHHAAADVNAHCRRNHRALGRDHRANCRANADMNIRHRCHMFKHKRHLGRRRKLYARLVVDGNAARPHLHMAATGHVHHIELSGHFNHIFGHFDLLFHYLVQ